MMNLTNELLINHMKNAVVLARQEHGKFDSLGFDRKFKGWVGSSYTGRRMLSNMCEIEGANYLEVGLCNGSTFIPAVKDNPLKKVLAMDTWKHADFCGQSNEQVEANFRANVKAFLGEAKNVKIMKGDCFATDLKKIKNKIDIYFYDGDHMQESQYKALTYFHPILADKFIYMVDDWLMNEVQLGTRRAIADLNLKVIHENHVPSGEEYIQEEMVSTPEGWAKPLGFITESNGEEFIKVQYTSPDGEMSEKVLPKNGVGFHFKDLSGKWWNGYGIFLLEKPNG